MQMKKNDLLKPGNIIEVYGCTWDEHWEFGSPSVLYSPFKHYGENGESTEALLEDIIVDILSGESPQTEWDKFCIEEFKWRGWNPESFKLRRNAWHTKITIKVVPDEEFGINFEQLDIKKQKGPFIYERVICKYK